MKINILTILIFVLIAQTQGFSQELTNSNHGKALDFGKSMAKAFFDNNCTAVYNSLATTVISMESGEQFLKSNFTEEQFCATNPVRKDMAASYAIYLKNYSPLVMTHVEFAEAYPQFQEIYQLQPGDFYFHGANLNKGATDLFKAADMLNFILRKTQKTNQPFEIIGM
jgi:hypothetical protein